MRQAFILIALLFSLSAVYSQNNDLSVTDESDSIATPKLVMNAVKTDAFSWIFGTAVLKYERVITEDLSFQLGGFYSWNFPAYDEEYIATGFAITPEIRYYPSINTPAPRGIYVAPNYRYQKLETENLEENSESTLVTNGIAINLGYQLVIKDLFLIDAWAGIAYNIRNVVEETVPGAEIGYNDENGVGVRIGVAIGLAF